MKILLDPEKSTIKRLGTATALNLTVHIRLNASRRNSKSMAIRRLGIMINAPELKYSVIMECLKNGKF